MGDIEIGIIYEPTLSDLWKLFAPHVTQGRHLREIWGAMKTPYVDADNRHFPSEMQHLDTTQKVDGFFMLTQSAPIYLLGVMSTLEGPNLRRNTPLPAHQKYLDPTKFAPLETYEELLEEDEELLSRRASVGIKRLLRRDDVFEGTIYSLRRKIRQITEIKQHLKWKHKEKFLEAIHCDDEGDFYHLFYPADGADFPSSGADIVNRQVQAWLDVANAIDDAPAGEPLL